MKEILSCSVSGAEWAFYAEEQATSPQSNHQYVQSIFFVIHTVEGRNENKKGNKRESLIHISENGITSICTTDNKQAVYCLHFPSRNRVT